jgi:hypothetical protein
MPEIILQNDVCISLGSIDSEEDLKPRQGLISINPPPPDGRCQCCGRHLNELKPFGKAGDPLVGDFEGALLVKKWRAFGAPDEEAERIYKKYLGRARTEPVSDNAAQQMALHLTLAIKVSGCVGASWECRDCIALSDYDYYKKCRPWEEARM